MFNLTMNILFVLVPTICVILFIIFVLVENKFIELMLKLLSDTRSRIIALRTSLMSTKAEVILLKIKVQRFENLLQEKEQLKPKRKKRAVAKKAETSKEEMKDV